MSSTTYPVETPRWLWNLFKRAIDDGTDYERLNDRLVEAIAVDVQRFEDAGFVELDDLDDRRIEDLLDDLQPDQAGVPSHTDGLPLTDRGGDPSSRPEPRGERSR